VLAALGLLAAACLWLPVGGEAAAGLDGQKVRVGLGIMLCIGVLWMTEALPLAVTALFVPVLAVAFRVSEMKVALAGFADPLIFLFLGGFALAAALRQQGLDRWFAGKLVALGKGRFVSIALLMFGGTAFVSMWMSNTATTAMMLPLALGVISQLPDGPDKGRNTTFLLLGLAYAASIGGLGTVIGSPPNGIAAAQLGISFSGWMRFGVPAAILLLGAMSLILYILLRPSGFLPGPLDEAGLVFNRARVATLGIFACTSLCWIFSAEIGPLLGIGGSLDTLIALMAILALVFFRVVGWKEIEKGTSWGMLLLFGGGIALGGVLKETGASVFLARSLTTTIAGWPLVLIIAAAVAFVIFVTELMSNTGVAALFVPIFIAIAAELNIGPLQLVAPLALAASCAFMMPAGTAPNALMFGTGLITQRSMMKAGLVLNLAFIVILTGLALALF
jgi:sodium-dependent dicarboxylate transporter 2/3/5